jgi:hypothetical protein
LLQAAPIFARLACRQANTRSACLPPHVEEHVAQKVFGDGLVADPTVNRGAVPGEQHLPNKPGEEKKGSGIYFA